MYFVTLLRRARRINALEPERTPESELELREQRNALERVQYVLEALDAPPWLLEVRLYELELACESVVRVGGLENLH